METKAPHKLTLGDDIFDVLPVQLADHLEWKAMSRSYQASDLHAPLLEPRRGWPREQDRRKCQAPLVTTHTWVLRTEIRCKWELIHLCKLLLRHRCKIS